MPPLQDRLRRLSVVLEMVEAGHFRQQQLPFFQFQVVDAAFRVTAPVFHDDPVLVVFQRIVFCCPGPAPVVFASHATPPGDEKR